jgi:hypothetical protein
MGVFGAAPEDMPGQGWNPFREFGENMFAQAERFRVGVARDLSNAPNAAINLALDGLRDNTCRALTAGEAAAAGGAFRGRLDLSDVRLCDGPAHNPDARFVLLLVGRPAITEGNTVFVRHDLFKADFSRAGSQAIGLILHELTHVVQYQSLGILGFAHRYVDELRDSGFDQDKLYNYEPGKSRFVSSTLEAQAQMVEDYSRATNATIRSKIARSLRGSGMFGL